MSLPAASGIAARLAPWPAWLAELLRAVLPCAWAAAAPPAGVRARWTADPPPDVAGGLASMGPAAVDEDEPVPAQPESSRPEVRHAAAAHPPRRMRRGSCVVMPVRRLPVPLRFLPDGYDSVTPRSGAARPAGLRLAEPVEVIVVGIELLVVGVRGRHRRGAGPRGTAGRRRGSARTRGRAVGRCGRARR